MNKLVKGVITLAIGAAIGFGSYGYFRYRDVYHVTHEDTWETITRSEYSMTIPADMQDGNVLMLDNSSEVLDCFASSEVMIAVYVTRWSSEEKELLKQVNLTDLIMQTFQRRTINGMQLEPVQRGEMIYVEYPRNTTTMFKGTDTVQTIDACFISDDGLYEIEVYCPENKYSDYQTYMLSWLDSFKLY